jgi:protein-S-isoprenylcysteine O-methyltransferase Ste14
MTAADTGIIPSQPRRTPVVRRIDAFAYRHRNLLAGLPLLYAIASSRWEWENTWGTWSLAVLAAGLGVVLRAWATCHNAYAQHRPQTLATAGPYAVTRNPLYIGNMLVLLGGTIASELVWLAPAVLLWAFLVYERVVRHEERWMERTYGGGYARYRDAVPRWLPRRVPHGETRRPPFLHAVLRQSAGLLVLLPYLLKEVDLFHLWHHR